MITDEPATDAAALAADRGAILDANLVQHRNLALEQQSQSMKLWIRDVDGDGNFSTAPYLLVLRAPACPCCPAKTSS